MQPRPATASDRPPFDAARWVDRARAVELFLMASPGGLSIGIPTGYDPNDLRRLRDELGVELRDAQAEREVWAHLLAWADR
ncbi:hypothetical protein [Methylobacterium sp. WL7]|uniref:hypothetical protein n=1 Tax=Methylobacterium sp. WL7 TaxID=2603900 RepID=UPI0011C7331E|nr:hypothetical protein [Methylobacterium sp. WL7]TXN43869.1 hypothetical protein FV233_16830 [Methylobacterium sp. WL7]